MESTITVKQSELENISADISTLVSQALAIQDQVQGIVEDKKRYENVEIEYHEKWIAFDLAITLQKRAKEIAKVLDDLIGEGGG